MILLFSDWVLSKPQGGLLGYQYDNLTRELVVQGDLPEGWAWDILVSASGKSDIWPLALGDGRASITLTDDNLSVRGEYYLQLRGTNGDRARHTNVITAYNSRSLSGAGQWPTLPTEWIQAEKDIKELNAHPPVPGLNGYWLLWDLSSHSYQESDLPVPVGPAGPPNVLEIGTVETLPADQPATASITGESPAQKLNLGIPQGKQGATGNPGAPGKDGKNGVTPTLSAGNVETLEPGQPATASVTGEGPAYQINLGIPRGQTGAQGAPGQNGEDGQTPTITVGTVTTLAPGQDATAEITGQTPDLTLNLGIPQGQPGKDGVQLNDNAVNTTQAWSSKKIVDTLCLPFTETGNPITCNPVEGYPLSAVVTLEPKQAGSGDPSPENVRPITGYDEVAVNVRGKNLFGGESIEGVIDAGNDELIVGPIKQYPTFITRIKPGKTYTASRKTTGIIRLAVSPEKPYLGITFPNAVSTTGNKLSITAGENEKWLACNVPYYQDDEVQLEEGSTPTPYEPYQPGTTATLTLPETIYGGTVDAASGVGSNETIMFELAIADMDNDENYPGWRAVTNLTDVVGVGYNASLNNEHFIACNITKSALTTDNKGYFGVNTLSTNSILYLPRDTFGLTQTQWKEQYPDLVLQLCLKRISPEPFQATGNQPLPAVAGLNTVYTDGDNLDVTGRQDLLYILQTMQTQTQNLNRFIAEGGTQ